MYRQLRNFRAGIEAEISQNYHSFGARQWRVPALLALTFLVGSLDANLYDRIVEAMLLR